jgi:DNA (cytosine-5)-methyltransferase 1
MRTAIEKTRLESPGGVGVRDKGQKKARRISTPTDLADVKSQGKQPTVASFFSGIGGFDLGFQNAGFKVTYQCEINKFCSAILKKHWPDVRKDTDIKKVEDRSTLPVSDVWVGGFPCQDVSVARMGPRAGLKGKQSGLFHEFARILEQGRPGIVVIENVPGLLSSHGGRDFGIVVRTLAELGYSVGWRVLNSKDFGVPQSRQRVFIVGSHGERRGPAEILFEPECGERDYPESGQNGEKPISPFKTSVGDLVKGPIVKKLAHCLYACSARHTGTDWSRNYASYPDGRVRRLVPVECERLQGFPDGWTVPDDEKFSLSDDLDSMRYHAIGNAVSVPVVQWLAHRIHTYVQKVKVTEKLA